MQGRGMWIGLALGVGVSMGVARVAQAQDPVVVGPHIYTVKLDNDTVRASEIVFQPGDKIAMHSHPDHLLYVVKGGTLQLSYPDGTTADVNATPGQVMWIPAESHAAVNIGTTEFKALVVELKPLPQ